MAHSLRILGICGSLQRSSGNLTLLQTAEKVAPAGTTLELYSGLRELPHFDPDIEKNGEAPAAVQELRRAVASADALLIASPEYGHSLPGSLKNAVDWLIGSGELEGKLVATTAAVPAAERGRLGLKALHDTLGAVSARLVGGEPIARGPGFEQSVRELMAELARAAGR